MITLAVTVCFTIPFYVWFETSPILRARPKYRRDQDMLGSEGLQELPHPLDFTCGCKPNPMASMFSSMPRCQAHAMDTVLQAVRCNFLHKAVMSPDVTRSDLSLVTAARMDVARQIYDIRHSGAASRRSAPPRYQ